MDFYKRLRLVCSRIPYGRVATYGQIALLCGKPRNSRQVGYGLHWGLAGTCLPAHRVVNHQGMLSGAATFEEPDTQRCLLEREGVKVGPDNRVDLKKYGWNHTLGDALWLRDRFEKEGI